jgi:antitoxin ParD1/3/4
MAAKAVTVTLGDMTAQAERHLASGRFASMSELVRAGLRALDREEAALDALLRARVAEALADERPSVPMADAFAAIRRAVAEPKA